MPGGPQNMGGPPRAQVVRRGTSKAVPVVVSAGLAVGVFCGLLFGLGTETAEATVAPSTGNNVKPKDKDDVPEAFAPTQAPGAGKTIAPVKPADGSATVAAGSGSDAAGSGSAVPAIVKTKLTIEVSPEAAAKVAKITIDGKEIVGNMAELDAGDKPKRTVKIVVKASGFRESTKEQEIEPSKHETYTLEIPLTKKSSGGSSGGSRPTVPGGGKKPTGKKPGGGLIDI